MGRFGHNGVISNTTTWVIEGNKAASHAVTACSFLFVASFATTWVSHSFSLSLMAGTCLLDLSRGNLCCKCSR